MIRSIFRQCQRLRALVRDRRIVGAQYRTWEQLKRQAESSPLVPNAKPRLLVVPCDAWSVIGSRGDEAMIVASIETLSKRHPGLEVGIITADAGTSEVVRRMGHTPLEYWRGPELLKNLYQAAETFAPTWAIILGADVMDGYYSPSTSLALLSSADLLARRGVKTSLLGFSFNKRPSPLLRKAFSTLSPKLNVNVRDPISLGRLREFAPKVDARLVADAAFMLTPDPNSSSYPGVSAWVAGRKAAGDTVVGINLHPMLIKNATQSQIDGLAVQFGAVLNQIAKEFPVSFLLLPHDYRSRVNDRSCLAPLAEQLKPRGEARVRFVETEHSAAELKALVGLADALISSRMHLAIGALGMKVPVFAFSYQDKFHGLMRHFELEDWLIVPPPSAGNRESLLEGIRRFVREHGALHEQVAAKLPAVKACSQRNLSFDRDS